MNTGRTAILFALLAATAALATGCGGDDDEETTAPETVATGAAGELTADQWVSQADAICTQGDRAQDVAIRDFFDEEGIPQDQRPSSAQIQQLTSEVIIPNIESQIDGVAELPRPEEEADLIDQFIDQANQDLDRLKADPSLIEGSDDPFAETSELADQLGLKECAS
jgi:hypothetical protein